MTTLIRGGTVIDADRSWRADVLCADPQQGGTILQVGPDLKRRRARRSLMRVASM